MRWFFGFYCHLLYWGILDVKKMLIEFMGSEGTYIHRRFSQRSLVYVRYVLERGDDVTSPENKPS